MTERRILLVLVLLYVCGIGALAFSGNFSFVWKMWVIPALLLAALLTGRLRGFLIDWSPFLALVFLFDSLRGLIYTAIERFDLPVYMVYVAQLERALAGRPVLPARAQAWMLESPFADELVGLLVAVHSSHFVAFLLVGFGFWLLSPSGFLQYRRGMLALMYLGLVGYLLAPTVPPWLAAEHWQGFPAIRHIAADVYRTYLPELHRAFDVNPIAAMPSLHAAFPTLCTLLVAHHVGLRRSFALVLYTLLVYVAAVFLGEHYLVDILAGAVLAAVIYDVLVHRLPKRFEAEVEDDERPRSLLRPLALCVCILLIAEAAGQVTVHERRARDEMEAAAAETEGMGR